MNYAYLRGTAKWIFHEKFGTWKMKVNVAVVTPVVVPPVVVPPVVVTLECDKQ